MLGNWVWDFGNRGLGDVNVRRDDRVLGLRDGDLRSNFYVRDGGGGDRLLLTDDLVLKGRKWNFGGKGGWLVSNNQGR